MTCSPHTFNIELSRFKAALALNLNNSYAGNDVEVLENSTASLEKSADGRCGGLVRGSPASFLGSIFSFLCRHHFGAD